MKTETEEAVQQLRVALDQAIVNESDFMSEKTLEVRKEHIREVLAFLKQRCGYAVLTDLTGVDYLEPMKRTKVVYWLHNPSSLARIRIVGYAARDEVWPSVTEIWEGADWYERELYDFFGVQFEGHPDMKRLLMPDDWQGHPLRKDYALTEEPVQFKHDVKPKIPSQIIQHVKGNKEF